MYDKESYLHLSHRIEKDSIGNNTNDKRHTETVYDEMKYRVQKE